MGHNVTLLYTEELPLTFYPRDEVFSPEPEPASTIESFTARIGPIKARNTPGEHNLSKNISNSVTHLFLL